MAERKRRFIVEILGDAKGLIKANKQADDSTNELSGRFGKLGEVFGGTFSRIGSTFDPLANKLSGGMKRMGVDAEVSGDALASGLAGGLATAGAAVGAFVLSGVNEFAKLGVEVLKFQRVTGIAAEDSSRLVAVLDDFEVPAEAGAVAMGRLARTIETAPARIERYGVEIKRASDGTVDMAATLASVADAYAATDDPTKRAALGAAAFGRAYQGLIPILEQGGSALRESMDSIRDGQIFSQEDLQAAEDYRLAMDRLGDSFGDLQRTAGKEAIPAVTESLGRLASILEGIDDLNQSRQDGPLGRLASQALDLGSSLAPMTAQAKSAADMFKTLTGSAEDQTEALEDTVTVIDAMDSALGFVEAAQQAAKDAAEDAAIAAEEQAEAEKNLADRIANVTDELNNRTDATMRAFSADLQLRGAVRSTTEALGDLDEVQSDAAAGTIDAAEAAIALEEAIDDAASAALNQAGAAVRLAEEQAKSNGETLTAQQRTKIMRDELDKVAGTLAPGSPLMQRLNEYREALAWANEEARKSASASSGAFRAASFDAAGAGVSGVATGDPTSLAAARDRLASSTEGVADAQARLARMQELGEQDAAKLAAGERAIEQAMISQAQATVALERTQAELRGETYSAIQAAETYNRVLSAGAETLAPGSSARTNLMGYITDVQFASQQLQALADAQARREAEAQAARERETASREQASRQETARREEEARREAELSLFGLRRGRDQAAAQARSSNDEVFNAALRMLHGSGSVREYEDALERARDATVSLANQDARVAEAEARAAGQSFGAADEARITAESLRRFATQLPDTDPLKALLLGDATSIASLGRVNVTIVQPSRATWDQQDLRDYQDRQDILAVPTLRG